MSEALTSTIFLCSDIGCIRRSAVIRTPKSHSPVLVKMQKQTVPAAISMASLTMLDRSRRMNTWQLYNYSITKMLEYFERR
jgi:hypothetical protein